MVQHKESQDVSSDDDLSSDSDDEVEKGSGWNAFGLPNSSKAVTVVEGESYSFVTTSSLCVSLVYRIR